jgi:hypothetical protein
MSYAAIELRGAGAVCGSKIVFVEGRRRLWTGDLGSNRMIQLRLMLG